MPAQEEPTFPCPRCHQPSGRQDKFAMHEGDTIKVIVRCGKCRHRWSVIMAAGEYASLPGRSSE